eukprot:6045002-Ditylum_brightwellii.AAC.1
MTIMVVYIKIMLKIGHVGFKEYGYVSYSERVREERLDDECKESEVSNSTSPTKKLSASTQCAKNMCYAWKGYCKYKAL